VEGQSTSCSISQLHTRLPRATSIIRKGETQGKTEPQARSGRPGSFRRLAWTPAFLPRALRAACASTNFPQHVPRTSIIGFSIGHPHRTMTDGVPVIATLNYEHVPIFGVPMLQRRPLVFCPKRQPCRVRKRGCSGEGGIIKSMHLWQTNC
jgi:hypothetical protein